MIDVIETTTSLTCKVINGENGKTSILIICISGIETVVKLKNLIEEGIGYCYFGLKEYEYSKLSLMRKEYKIFNSHDIRIIVSTTKIDMDFIYYELFKI